ncbi:MAG: hypothetical protein HY319_21660 [Armatimonadetes bacterium]|nr:hypothetical protein [Armatimonadota bacterium]
MTSRGVSPEDFTGWTWLWDEFWVHAWDHVQSPEFLFFLVLAGLILLVGTHGVYYPLFYYGHQYRAASSIRLAYWLSVVTILILYLNMFWCSLAPFIASYWLRLAVGVMCLLLLLFFITVPKRKMAAG